VTDFQAINPRWNEKGAPGREQKKGGILCREQIPGMHVWVGEKEWVKAELVQKKWEVE